MATERNYTIEIKLPTDSGGSNSESPVSTPSTSSTTGGNGGGTTTNTSSSSTSSGWLASNANSAKSAVKGIVSFSTAASLADKFISYDISTISLRTGATEYEQKVQFAYNTAKSTVLPVAIGLATGGAAGAVIGLAYSGITKLITYSQNARTIDYNRQLENISLGLAQQRAGISGSRSS